MNAFFNAQFSYCALTWTFHSRKLNNRINKLHGRYLRIVYNDNTSTYDELLETENSVSVHFRNVQALAIELYKVVNGFSPDIMKDIFPIMQSLFTTPGIKKRSIQGILELFILDLKRYHILHLKFGSLFQKRLKS